MDTNRSRLGRIRSQYPIRGSALAGDLKRCIEFGMNLRLKEKMNDSESQMVPIKRVSTLVRTGASRALTMEVDFVGRVVSGARLNFAFPSLVGSRR